jgi:hypothetical protein
MKATVQKAAKSLLESVPAPRGALNAEVWADANGPMIRVFVDPMYWLSVSIPSNFQGYKVIVEKREPTVAFR